jgi:hypothetical protein
MTEKITRREALFGAALATVAGGAGIVIGTPRHEDTPPLSTPGPAPVPTDDELRKWEHLYRVRYRAQHRARNAEFLEATQIQYEGGHNNIDPTPKRADQVLADLELEIATAEQMVTEGDALDVAMSRGHGFSARRDGKSATENPHLPGAQYWRDDRFMAWYAGWVQAEPRAVLGRDDPARHRGYTPPPQHYACPLCGVDEGGQHTGPQEERWDRVHDAWSSDGHFAVPQEACEDHTLVVRPRPPRRPGVTHT